MSIRLPPAQRQTVQPCVRSFFPTLSVKKIEIEINIIVLHFILHEGRIKSAP